MLAGHTHRLRDTGYWTDLCVLVFVTGGVAAGSGSLGIHDSAAVACFTLAWTTTAMTRLREFRQGRRPALKLDSIDRGSAAMLLAGTVPWFLLGFLQSVYPTLAFWTPFAVTPQMRALGMLLAIGVVAEPFFQSTSKEPLAPAAESQFSFSILIRSAAILLLSGSTVFTLFCGLWLTLALWRAHGSLLKTGGRLRISVSSVEIGAQPVAPQVNS